VPLKGKKELTIVPLKGKKKLTITVSSRQHLWYGGMYGKKEQERMAESKRRMRNRNLEKRMHQGL
jgi:hypothetical protein